ncbi:MAG: transposase [Flavobacteriales bacterium]|nr:transposase [Flavobacteriales bacterium]
MGPIVTGGWLRGFCAQRSARGYFQPHCSHEKVEVFRASIIAILKQHEAAKVADICREHTISAATFHNWKARYGGMEPSQLKRVKELEEELSRLKRMYTELSMENDAMKAVIQRSGAPDEKREIVQALNGR